MQCPGLIGPSELSRWQVKFDFANRQLEVFGEPHPMRLTATRHPALDLLDFGATTDPWRSPGIEEKKVQLIHAPQSLAFLSEGRSGQEIREDADAEGSDTTGSSCRPLKVFLGRSLTCAVLACVVPAMSSLLSACLGSSRSRPSWLRTRTSFAPASACVRAITDMLRVWEVYVAVASGSRSASMRVATHRTLLAR